MIIIGLLSWQNAVVFFLLTLVIMCSTICCWLKLLPVVPLVNCILYVSSFWQKNFSVDKYNFFLLNKCLKSVWLFYLQNTFYSAATFFKICVILDGLFTNFQIRSNYLKSIWVLGCESLKLKSILSTVNFDR